MASELLTQIREAAAHVRGRTKHAPEVGIILGTGLGDFADALETEVVVPYAEIPHFPRSTVESHAGELHVGRLAGRPVAVMKGRVHYYEGYSMRQVGFPTRVFKAIGLSEEDARAKFGFLLDAFRHGPPPHGGIAAGLDRHLD